MIASERYRADIARTAELALPWERLQGKRLLITGASGMIGAFLVDVLMYRNQQYEDGITVWAAGRNKEKADRQFGVYPLLPEGSKAGEEGRLFFKQWDVTMPLSEEERFYDYIIHGASNTHPRAYAGDPIGTITGNVSGLLHLLEHAERRPPVRLMLMSSVEIYGEDRGEKSAFSEHDLGYLDCNTLRAGYPESKRLCETLCQAYRAQHGIDFVTGRFSRVYGPTMGEDDSKALAQFIRRAVRGQDIVLKSRGDQYYSYTYVADAVSALLQILLCGEGGQAYNVAGEAITLKKLAHLLAAEAGTQVVFELPDALEQAGYSTATRAVLDTARLQKLGWRPDFTMKEGLTRTVEILRECEKFEMCERCADPYAE